MVATRTGPDYQEAPTVNCMLPLTLARQLGSVGGRICLLASERPWENVLTVHAYGLQKCIRTVPFLSPCASFKLGVGKSHDCLHSLGSG